MDTHELYLMLGAFFVFAMVAVWGITRSDTFRMSLKGWFGVDAGKHQAKDQTIVDKIRNESEVDIASPDHRHVSVKNIDKSKVTIRK